MGYRYWAAAAFLLLGLCLGGCATGSPAAARADTSTVLILNGADGPGPWYNTLVDGLREGRAADRVEMLNWGAPWLVLSNLSFSPLHHRAESRLVDRVLECRKRSPEGRITLVGHSAGCGVIVRALEKLPEGTTVDGVLLLAPCVSQGYDLTGAMAHVAGEMHIFHSEHDQLLLKYSTLITGTYDHVWSRSAGLNGFTRTGLLDAQTRSRIVQHPYDAAWKSLGHHGGHFGVRSEQFAANILAPIASGTIAPAEAPPIARAPDHATSAREKSN